jgi:transposase
MSSCIRTRHARVALLIIALAAAAPGTRAHDVACAAARVSAVRERPDVQGPLDALLAEVARARRSELMDWTTEQSGALLAEVDHLRRMAQLVPRLDAALERMILPDPARAGAAAAAPVALPPGVAVSRP